MTTTEPDIPLSEVAAHDILRRIMAQREGRYSDAGPDLGAAGKARFRHEGSRLHVAYAQVDPLQTTRLVSLVIGYAARSRSRIVWNVAGANADSEHLTATLLEQRFLLEERMTLMARQGALRCAVNKRIRVAPITTWTDMWTYERGNRQAFYDDPSPATSLVTARASDRWRQQHMGWYQYYTVSLDGHFAGGAYVSLWEDVPTLMGVYTVEGARNQGVATAVMAAMVASVLAAGKSACCLFVKHGNPARRLYESLGFVALSAEATYVLDA